MWRYSFPLYMLTMSAFLFSCKSVVEPPTQSKQQLSPNAQAAKFYYDLGPSTVDVSGYPAKIKDSYKTFLAACSSCHTPARPLNSPLASAADWKRYIKKMHVKAAARGIRLDREQQIAVLDFLTYDSKKRKIDRREKFLKEQENLKKLYARVSEEQKKMILEETNNLAVKETPYVGVK